MEKKSHPGKLMDILSTSRSGYFKFYRDICPREHTSRAKQRLYFSAIVNSVKHIFIVDIGTKLSCCQPRAEVQKDTVALSSAPFNLCFDMFMSKQVSKTILSIQLQNFLSFRHHKIMHTVSDFLFIKNSQKGFKQHSQKFHS